jgi:hypothetical protein
VTGDDCVGDRRRCEGDRGFVGGAEAPLFSVLVFVVGMLLLANAWAVIDAKMAVSSASREAVRYLVESDGDTGGAAAAGSAAFASYGRDAGRLNGPSIAAANGLARCSRVTVTYEYQVPALSLPLIGGWGRAFNVSASHSEIVDPFRSGLEGEAQC